MNEIAEKWAKESKIKEFHQFISKEPVIDKNAKRLMIIENMKIKEEKSLEDKKTWFDCNKFVCLFHNKRA
jgi:hypothetical protein